MMSEETELSKQRELIKDWEELNVLQGVTHCLQLCHLLETWRKDVLIRLSPSLRFCKLALVFLISSDLFLNIELRRYLSSNLHRMADRNELCSLKFDDSLKIELASFHDL